MVEVKRRVICDCCGREIEEFFGGFETRALGKKKRLYDLCTECLETLESRLEYWEEGVIDEFANTGGRINEREEQKKQF